MGKYRVDNEEGYAILMLRPDKTYLQTINYADARKEITATGRWDFDAETQLLTLRDSYGVSSYAFGRKSDAAGLPVYKVFGTVRLTADGDYGLVYKKLGD